jgi:hypothetical protein
MSDAIIKKCKIVFQHGWGFSGEIWQGWKKITSGFNSYFLDCGYFSDPITSDIAENDNVNYLIISHSFGLHLISEQIINNAKACVIFGGFHKLCSSEEDGKNRHEIMFYKMIENFKKCPEETLEKFYRNVYFPENAIDKINMIKNKISINYTLLHDDLIKMTNHELRIETFKKIPQIIIMYGKKDRIVPFEKGKELHKKLTNSTYFEFEDAGHALPFTHAEKSWKLISNELKI